MLKCLVSIVTSQHAQINCVVSSSHWGACRHRKSFRERHRSHIFATCSIAIIVEARLRAIVQIFHSFLRCGWCSVRRGLACIICGQDHVLYISARMALSIPETMVATAVRWLLLGTNLFCLVSSRGLLLLMRCLGCLRSDLMLLHGDLLLTSGICGRNGSCLVQRPTPSVPLCLIR